MKKQEQNRFTYDSDKGLNVLSEEDILNQFEDKKEEKKIEKSILGENGQKVINIIGQVLSNPKSPNQIKGGLADKMSVEDIAKKHGVEVSHIKSQIKMGLRVELEHTNDPRKALEIAMDHMVESPDYYTKLKEMEESFED